jgi:hypothetical protein
MVKEGDVSKIGYDDSVAMCFISLIAREAGWKKWCISCGVNASTVLEAEMIAQPYRPQATGMTQTNGHTDQNRPQKATGHTSQNRPTQTMGQTNHGTHKRQDNQARIDTDHSVHRLTARGPRRISSPCF